MDREKVLKRIQTCLDIADRGGNEHEVALALQQAQKLMQKYGISDHDVQVADVNEASTHSSVARKPATWEQELARVVSRAFGAKVIYRSGYRDYKGEWVFIGVGVESDVSSYTFDVLLRQLKRARQQHLQTRCPNVKRATKTLRGDLFCSGWVEAVKANVVAFADSYTHQAAIETYMGSTYPELGTLTSRDDTRKATWYDWQAHEEGQAAGSQVNIHAGVQGKSQPRKRLK